jgi:hypothetical protein
MNAITPNLSKPCKGNIQQQAFHPKLPIAKQLKALYNIMDGSHLTKGHTHAYCAY